MRLTNMDLPTVFGAACGAAGTAMTFLSEIAMQALGVPLPVVMAAAAGAGLARALSEPVNFFRAVFVTAGWTVLGCVCAPAAQALIPWLLRAVPGTDALVLPANALSGVAALVSSATWWWPKVLPAILARFGKGGANA